ncbi:hypothetical protein GCM10022286_00400 [Gryllotalpicola daejeonensis]|uniref:Uncharacterized protein n=1 Tax=Gryllotalpicola daejeonensis TaxID=993087 RepID=A0ABP7ZCQ7_9MICO
MTDRTVAIFIDLDGVCATWKDNEPIESPAWPDSRHIEVQVNRGHGYREVFPLTYSPTMVSELREILDDPRVQPVALTTWLENEIYVKAHRMMGLPPMPGARMPARDAKRRLPLGWKHRSLREWLEHNDAVAGVIWIDDQDAASDLPWPRIVSEALGVTPLLAIAPDESIGITPEHVVAVRTFIDEVTR